MLDTPPGPVSDQNLALALRRHHSGALSHSPVDLIDRLTDHFLRVLAGRPGRVGAPELAGSGHRQPGPRRRGSRALPPLKLDPRDALNDRVHQLAGNLEPAELIGLLDAIHRTIQALDGSATGVEAGALARTALNRSTGLWAAAHMPISVPGTRRLVRARRDPDTASVAASDRGDLG